MGLDRPIDITANQRKTILALLKRHLPNTMAWVYGSRVKWTARPQSDLDLVVFATPDQERRVAELREAFEESNLPFRVDLFIWDAVPEQFRKEIEAEHVVLVEKEVRTIDSAWRETVYGRLPADFCKNSLANLCHDDNGVQTGPFGSQLHQKDYVRTGTPILTVEHLGENRVIHQDLPHVSDYDKERLSKYTLRKGDIVFSRVGSVDRRALVREAEDGWLFSGRCLRVRPDPDKIDSGYLSYFFGWASFQEYIRSIAVGATMPSLNTQILSDVVIPYPSLPEQRAIAHVLGTLDDKIELNRRMNETLEAMARALFKSWFIDFDPVRAKMAGRDPGLPQHLADLFPDHLVDSELGPIPEGWEVTLLGSLVDVIKGCSYTSKDLIDSKAALVTLKSFARGGGYRPDGLKPFAGPYKNGQVVSPGEVIIAATDVTQAAEVIGRPALVAYERSFQTLVASLDVLIIRPTTNAMYSQAFIYFLTGTPGFSEHMYAHTTGTTVLHLSKGAVPTFQFALPPQQLVECFDNFADTCIKQIQLGKAERDALSSMRDTLLPKLISGEIRVREADIHTQAIV